jgi:hypothetical protein
MYWLIGWLIGVAIGVGWVYVEAALAQREPIIW